MGIWAHILKIINVLKNPEGQGLLPFLDSRICLCCTCMLRQRS